MRDHRILFIDAARTYAIILALAAHTVGTFGVPDVGPWIMNYPFVTSMATPMFIFMFGVMMEVVYVRKAATERMSAIDSRLLRRSYQCYLAFILTALSALVAGLFGFADFVSAALIMGKSHHGNILLLYAIALLVMPFVIRVRIAYGIGGIVGLLALVSLAAVSTSYTRAYDLGSSGYAASRLLGVGSVAGGPSVLLGLLFILAGMMAGYCSRQGRKLYWFACASSCVILLLVALLTSLTSMEGVKNVITGYGYGRYRDADHILYFLMGTFYCLVAFCGIKWIVENVPQTHGLVRALSPLGMCSLLAFTFGNIVLNLWHIVGRGVIPPSLATPAFFLLVWAVCRNTGRIPTFAFWYNLFNPQLPGRRRASAQEEAS